ncbi:hypothetical protein MMC21_002662 [Puttea exsequens]|nr:hypothetical protein [Puttea exsequens]
MPGRKSTGPLIPSKGKPQKLKAQRSLNALAIAEVGAPVKSKIKRSRLGEVGQELTKRKRHNGDSDPELEEDPTNIKRRKTDEKDRFGNEIEVGSDSSGNEWTVGQVNEDDDSDLDSDEALGDSDEDRFEGFAFRGSASAPSKSKKRLRHGSQNAEADHVQDIDLREYGSEHDSNDEEHESLGEDAVDLADMLDGGDEQDSHAEDNRDSEAGGEDLEPDNGILSPDSETSSSREEEDQSMSSLFDNEDNRSEKEKLAALQDLISTMDEQDQQLVRGKDVVDTQESTVPSEFGLSSKRKLTVADMLPSINDPQLRKSLKLLADDKSRGSKRRTGNAKRLEVPLPQRQRDRLDRAAAYEQSKETLSRWIDTVKYNRRAEHLSFPLQGPNVSMAQGTQRLRSSSQKQTVTDLESTIQSILQASGLAAPNGRSEEDQLQAFEELQTRMMPLEEVQARRAELRRARELLFREEVRQKRINKIKSKSFRKVHRRERERMAQQEKDALVAAGVDDSESEKERQNRRRAEERVGARHRESRWAKGVKDSRRSKWDDDARGGVTEMARRNEELRRRIEGKDVSRDENEMLSSESEPDDEDGEEGDSNRLSNQLWKLEDRQFEFDESSRAGRLANMDFMKRAEAARKAQNDESLEQLRREEAGEETPSEDEGEEGPGRKLFGPTKTNHVPTETSMLRQKSEFEERLESDAGDDDDRDQEETEILIDTSDNTPINQQKLKPSLSGKRNHKSSQEAATIDTQIAENPWLSASNKPTRSSKNWTQDSNAPAIISNTLPTPSPPPASAPKPRSALKGSRAAAKALQTDAARATALPAPADLSDAGSSSSSSETHYQPFVLRNHDLVRKAFAGDSVVADFTKEKDATVADDDEKVISTALPGWGTWTGTGLSKKAKAQNHRAKSRNLATEPGVAPSKRQDAKLKNVIINEKRVKKSGKYMAGTLPHPFETRAQYERSLRLPVGPEWSTKETFQGMTKPRVLMKKGVIVPIAKPIL